MVEMWPMINSAVLVWQKPGGCNHDGGLPWFYPVVSPTHICSPDKVWTSLPKYIGQPWTRFAGVNMIRPSFSLSISWEHPKPCVFVKSTEEHTILPSGYAHVPFLLWKITCRTLVIFCRTSHWLTIWTTSWQVDSPSRKWHADSLSC